MSTSLISRTDPACPTIPVYPKPPRVGIPEFRLLGLEPREARLDVIRVAVSQAAADAKLDNAKSSGPNSSGARLTEVAVAGYHLLDPRRRRSQFERIQLLLWPEEEPDGESKPLGRADQSNPLLRSLAGPITRVRARPALNTVSPPATTSPHDERQAALAVFKSLRRAGRRAKILWIILAGLTLGFTATLALAVSLFG